MEGRGEKAMPPTFNFQSPSRSGVSLLEILIAIFVLLIGLLGVAAVIPAGRVEIVEALKADRGAACARACLHDARIRKMLDPREWCYPNGNPVVTTDSMGRQLAPYRMIVLDPLFISTHHDTPLAAATVKFPYLSETAIGEQDAYKLTVKGPLRVTLGSVYWRQLLPNPVKRSRDEQLAIARRLFTCRDDLLFPPPADPAERPRQTEVVDLDPAPNQSTVTTTAWPIRATDAVPGYDAATAPMRLQSECQSDYTWIVTIMPQAEMVDIDGNGTPDPFYNIDSNVRYQVSIAVYFKRDLTALPVDQTAYYALEQPTERFVGLVFLGGGWGGGDVQLYYATYANLVKAATHLAVKEGEWVMVPTASIVDPVTPYAWYRVVAYAGPRDAGDRNYWATLRGPDWRFEINNATIAFLLSDVIAVHTKTFTSEDLY